MIIIDLKINSKSDDEMLVAEVYPNTDNRFTIYTDDISDNEYQCDDKRFCSIIEQSDKKSDLIYKCDILNKTSEFNI